MVKLIARFPKRTYGFPAHPRDSRYFIPMPISSLYRYVAHQHS